MLVAFGKHVEPGVPVDNGETLLVAIGKIVAPVTLPLPEQHPRAVDTLDAYMQVISPCFAWGEAWWA